MADANTDFEKALTANPEKPGLSGNAAGETGLNAANGLGFAGETPANDENGRPPCADQVLDSAAAGKAFAALQVKP